MQALRTQIIEQLHKTVPSVQAIYLFGRVRTEHFTKPSDVDVGILGKESLNPLSRWNLLQQLAIALDRDVDLVDLTTAGRWRGANSEFTSASGHSTMIKSRF